MRLSSRNGEARRVRLLVARIWAGVQLYDYAPCKTAAFSAIC